MAYNIFIKLILFLFISLNSFSNVLYDKKDLVITDIELNFYKDFYLKYYNNEINNANSLKDLVLIKNVIRDLKENNSEFISKIDKEIISQFGREIIQNEIILNFYRFSKIRDEFIYNYFRNKLSAKEIENIFKNLNDLKLPVSKNNCLVIVDIIDLKENQEFIKNFFFNLKNSSKNYKVNINGLDYDVCIDNSKYYKIEQLIVAYIRAQTDEEFEKFVYEKTRN